jgi:hypothetical protein
MMSVKLHPYMINVRSVQGTGVYGGGRGGGRLKSSSRLAVIEGNEIKNVRERRMIHKTA